MRRPISILSIVVSSSLFVLACAGAGPGGGAKSRGARSGGVTAPSAWPLPPGCVSRFKPDSYGHVKDVKPLLITDAGALMEQVECREEVKLDFDFSEGALGMFPFASEGGSFKDLSVKDEGGTVTLTVESRSYCGGTPPPTITQTFFYRVPHDTERLATNVVPADQPPCSPYIP